MKQLTPRDLQCLRDRRDRRHRTASLLKWCVPFEPPPPASLLTVRIGGRARVPIHRL